VRSRLTSSSNPIQSRSTSAAFGASSKFLQQWLGRRMNQCEVSRQHGAETFGKLWMLMIEADANSKICYL
jgi:hypothetical protein